MAANTYMYLNTSPTNPTSVTAVCTKGGGYILGHCLFLLPLFVFSPVIVLYSKSCVKRSLSKRLNIGFQDQLSLNAGQKYFDLH